MATKRPVNGNWVRANVIWIGVVAFKLASIIWICVVAGMLITEFLSYAASVEGFNLGRLLKALGKGLLILIGPPIAVAFAWKCLWSILKK